MTELRTDRLILRRWQEADRAPFAALNASPEVMEHFERTLTPAESDAFIDELEQEFDERGWALWAMESRETGALLGFTGLKPYDATPGMPFTPTVEVGWRMAREAWGFGYATEAARAAVDYGFTTLELPEIVSMTATANERSVRVMERIGMTRDPADDFDHPAVDRGHPLERHVLYRLKQEDWRA
jgi:ribosomal-protein-alanine N-acetyltransferase